MRTSPATPSDEAHLSLATEMAVRVTEYQGHSRTCLSGGTAQRLGHKLQRIAAGVLEQWHLFRGGTISRGELAVSLDPDIGRLYRLLPSGCRCAERKAAQFRQMS